MAVHYLQLDQDYDLPKLDFEKPYKCVIIIDKKVSNEYQRRISEWLVETGCLYMMAWGIECIDWNDSVDDANLEKFNWGKVPNDSFVMTTLHKKETLDEVFWFCHHCSWKVDSPDLQSLLLLDIGGLNREKEILKLYEEAKL